LGRRAGTTASYRAGTEAPITNAILNGDEHRFAGAV